MSLFSTTPSPLFAGLTVQERSHFGNPLAPLRSLSPSCQQLVAALKQRHGPETHQRLQQLVQESYSWFSNNNRVEAEQCVVAASIAYRMQLPQQLSFYQDKLITLCTKDMADRTCALVQTYLGYPEFRYCYPQRFSQQMRSFTVPIETTRWRELQWVYYRLAEFPQLIPVHALKALTTLDQAGIVPDGFWVADKVEVIRPHVSLDPVLCCHFDQWFVGLAQWE